MNANSLKELMESIELLQPKISLIKKLLDEYETIVYHHISSTQALFILYQKNKKDKQQKKISIDSYFDRLNKGKYI